MGDPKLILLAVSAIYFSFISQVIAQAPPITRTTRGPAHCYVAPAQQSQQPVLRICNADGDQYEMPSLESDVAATGGTFCFYSNDRTNRARCLNGNDTAWNSVENRGCLIREVPFAARQLPGRGAITRANISIVNLPPILSRMGIENNDANAIPSLCKVSFPRGTRLSSRRIYSAAESRRDNQFMTRIMRQIRPRNQCDYVGDPALPGTARPVVAHVDTCQRPMCVADVNCVDSVRNIPFTTPASCLANTDGSCPPAARCMGDTRTSTSSASVSSQTTPDDGAIPQDRGSGPAATTDDGHRLPLPPRDF